VATLARPLLQMPPAKTLEVELVPAQPLPMAPEVAAPPPAQPPPRPRVAHREPPKVQPRPAPPVMALNTPVPVQPRSESVPVAEPSPPAAAPESNAANNAPPAATTAAAPAAPSASVSTTPPSSTAAYLNNPRPPYPRLARRNGEQGTVILRVLVTRQGMPARVETDKSSGSPILDDAALETVKGWRFVPARRGNDPVEEWVRVPIVFKLQDMS